MQPPPPPPQQYYAAQGRQLFVEATNPSYVAVAPVEYVAAQPTLVVQQPGYVAYPGVYYGGRRLKHKGYKFKGYKFKGYKRHKHKGFKFF